MSPDLTKKIKIAAVQAAPVFLNREATTEKVCRLIREAGNNGADVIGFPEGFIPSFPSWMELVPGSGPLARSLFHDLFHQSVEVPGPEVEAIQQACREANIYAVVGINERRSGTTGTLYNTQLTFGRDGELLHKHQKYVPTVGERLVHAPGTTGSKASVPTDFGCLSSLICGENGNPLAAYSVSLDYPVVHVASWPPHWGLGSNMQEGVEVITRGLANSLSCYVINSVTAISNEMIEKYGVDEASREFLREEQKRRRASVIAPGGAVVAGQLDEQEGILYADGVSASDQILPKYSTDYAGHYNRPEIFAHHFEQYLGK
ncbi:hypothetical protein FQN54_006539 [Arachnomyces sp. PD_36]|nr:hypothetical protein FQN54_006539 [Arachnomyces sp. PD_36]